MTAANINNVFRVNNGHDYYVEAFFQNLQEADEFLDDLRELGAIKLRRALVASVIRENYLFTKKDHFSLCE